MNGASKARLVASLFATLCTLPGCGEQGDEGGVEGTPGTGGTAGSGGGEHSLDHPDPGTILVTVSGGLAALGGFAFPPAASGDVAFVDGWELSFERVIVTLDHLVVATSPDLSPTDQSRTDEALGQVDGPWAIELHAGGPRTGKSGNGEQAEPFTLIEVDDVAPGIGFDQRLAFGFDVVGASDAAEQVNFDGAARDDYAEMVAHAQSVLYVGTARFVGTSCQSSGGYDFTRLPGVVDFRLAFSAPARFVNCQNPDNDPANAFPGEEHQRGVQILANTYVVAQINLSLAEPFLDALGGSPRLRFDPLAARLVGSAAKAVSRDDMSGVDFSAFHDAAGAALPARNCIDGSPAPGAGALSYDPNGVPLNPSADPAKALRDFADYTNYLAGTAARLDGDGKCHVERLYPSPD